MHKNSLLAALGAAALLLSGACNKLPEGRAAKAPAAGEVLLKVSLGDAPGTKVAAQTPINERMIRNVQIFVFRAGSGGDAGSLEIAASSGFDGELEVGSGAYSGLTLKCSTGEREIWAVVNDSADRTVGPDAVVTKAALLALTHELKDSRPDKLLMVGSVTRSLREGTEEVELPVRRLAASVILESVKNEFLSPAYQKSGTFRVEDCYLINVPGRISFEGTSDAAALPQEDWYARMGAETGSPRGDLVYDHPESPKIVDYGSSDTTPHSFYAYPNGCEFSEDASWSPRATLLVLEASLYNGSDWIKYYYPVVITGGLSSNRQYRVSLTIHRPGSQDPNKPVRFDDVTPVVQVSDWDGGDNYQSEI